MRYLSIAFLLLTLGVVKADERAQTIAMLKQMTLHRAQMSGGGTELASIQIDDTTFNLAFAFFLTNGTPSKDWLANIPTGTCGVLDPNQSGKYAYLDVGRTLRLETQNTVISMPRLFSESNDGGVQVYQLGYVSAFDSEKDPIDYSAHYALTFAGDGWVGAQKWNRALRMPAKIEMITKLSFKSALKIAKGSDFKIEWTPTGSNEMVIEFGNGANITQVCHVRDSDGEFVVPSSVIAKISAKGFISVYGSAVNYARLLGREIALRGSGITAGLYVVE